MGKHWKSISAQPQYYFSGKGTVFVRRFRVVACWVLVYIRLRGLFLNAVPSIRCRRHTLSGDNVKIFLGEGPALFFFFNSNSSSFLRLIWLFVCWYFHSQQDADQSTVSGSFSLMLSRFYLIDFFYIFSYYHQTKIEKKKKLQQSHSNVRLGGPTTISLFFSFFSLNINMYY